jgi:hypothetical protein
LEGKLVVYQPLGGTGPTAARRWADSVLILSISDGGDTIVWVGQAEGYRLAGGYVVTGGSAAGQIGRWALTRTSGPALAPGPRPQDRILASALAELRMLAGATTPSPDEQAAAPDAAAILSRAVLDGLIQRSNAEQERQDYEANKAAIDKYYTDKYYKQKHERSEDIDRQRTAKENNKAADDAAAQRSIDNAAADQAAADRAAADRAEARAAADRAAASRAADEAAAERQRDNR